MSQQKLERPVRAGVYDTVDAADRAVRALLDAGFAEERISVVCSDEAKERHFAAFHRQDPGGAKSPVTAKRGSVIGGIAGVVVGAASVVATGGMTLVVFGPLAGALFGGFVGAMAARGVEREVAHFYDQALRRGQILVAAEVEPGDDPALLTRAEHVLAGAGTRPVRLPEG